MSTQEQKLNNSEPKFKLKEFWLRLWELVEPFHRQIVVLLVFIVFLEAFSLIGPYILKLIIDLVTRFDMSEIRQLIILMAAMFGANLLNSFFNFLGDRRILRILVDVYEHLTSAAHKKMMFLDLAYHEKENTGNKVAKIHRGTDKIDNLLISFFWEVAPTIFQVIFTTIVLFWQDWRFGMIIFIFIPAFIFLTARANKFVAPYRKKIQDEEEEAAGMMTQAVININTVKSFVQESREYGQFKKLREKIKIADWVGHAGVFNYVFKRNIVIDTGRALILLLGVFLVWRGQITIGSLVFVFTISEKALISLFRISRLYDRIMDSSEAVSKLYSLAQDEPRIVNSGKAVKPKAIIGRIEFNNVSFVYEESDIKALDNVNLKIGSDCVTALVGPSGGGKTTLARMIYRHYDPVGGGRVLLDGRDLKEYDLYSFRKFIAIVPQDVEVFNSSVRDNIAYGHPGASFREISAAARIANAAEFIEQMKEGYETLVGERGVKLSGGQRQRVGIARAILANPRILIFDEATSNLDSQSERLIQESLDKIMLGRTVIIIAHRLSTIKKADKIIVLEKGRVVQEGSHFELSRIDGGLYQKLLKLQEMGEVD